MKKSGDSKLREQLWRTSLASIKEAEVERLLSAQGDDVSADLVEEAKLSGLLARLPDAPVSSNFTARVLQAAELENLKISRKRGWPAWRVGFGWVSRLAMAGFIVAAGLLTFRINQTAQRAEMAHSIAQLSTVGVVPTEWLQNFDTIKHLSVASAVDDELLAALK